MREKKEYADRTRLHSSDLPKKKYILAFEGTDTEPIYFNMIDERKVELGIDSLVMISPIIRSFSESGCSHPKVIAEKLMETLTIQSSGKYPMRRIIDWIVEYLFSNKILEIGSDKINTDLQDICCNELHLSLEEDVEYNDLEQSVTQILNCYIAQLAPLSIADLAECAKSIIDSNQIVYDPEFDVLCLIVDRDRKSFKDEQYDWVLEFCHKYRIKLFVSNPCFEFWLLLHYDDVIDIDQDALKINKKDKRRNGRTFAERELKRRMPQYTKTAYPAHVLFSRISKALANEKLFCEELTGLKESIGSNIGLLISQMQNSC